MKENVFFPGKFKNLTCHVRFVFETQRISQISNSYSSDSKEKPWKIQVFRQSKTNAHLNNYTVLWTSVTEIKYWDQTQLWIYQIPNIYCSIPQLILLQVSGHKLHFNYVCNYIILHVLLYITCMIIYVIILIFSFHKSVWWYEAYLVSLL